jgi:hypothetical protein
VIRRAVVERPGWDRARVGPPSDSQALASLAATASSGAGGDDRAQGAHRDRGAARNSIVILSEGRRSFMSADPSRRISTGQHRLFHMGVGCDGRGDPSTRSGPVGRRSLRMTVRNGAPLHCAIGVFPVDGGRGRSDELGRDGGSASICGLFLGGRWNPCKSVAIRVPFWAGGQDSITRSLNHSITGRAAGTGINPNPTSGGAAHSRAAAGAVGR